MINRLENSYKDKVPVPVDYSKIKVGLKTLDDAVFSLGDINRANPYFTDKENVINAIQNNDFQTMRDISCFYYKTSGIYNRLCRYMAYMYRYDWFITPHIISNKMQSEKILDLFYKVLFYLDNSNIKKFFGESALKVLKNGCYYGYLIFQKDKFSVQELPVKYCRTRFMSRDGNPAIEFNMQFFNDYFRDTTQRARMLNLFPEEFRKGYRLYRDGKLTPTYQGDSSGWYLLDTNAAFKFNINGEDFPMFISVIPSLIDLDAAKELDRKKMAQQLLKIIIQKMPIDKNGDLVFDPEEARDLHNTAVQMLKRAVGVDVFTTFADTKVEDMAENSNSLAADQLERVERAVYNEAGVSQMQFNTDGNLALEKSVLNDEASLFNLIQQFEDFLELVIKQFNKNSKKIFFKVQILPTTIYNYKELSKLYKEQTQLGYTKMLPQLALGQSQSSILANAYFENDILDLVNVFIPPMMSSTMSANALKGQIETDKKSGRPEKADDEKTEKTLQNKESLS